MKQIIQNMQEKRAYEAKLTPFRNMHATTELIDYRSVAALDSSCGKRCTSNAIVQWNREGGQAVREKKKLLVW